jgi:benzodiazapine receptor
MSTYKKNSERGKNSFFRNAILFVSFIIVAQMAGIIGSIFTTNSVDTWYREISRPSFTPPNWLFAPVWITLYLLMGISAYLVWKKGANKKEVKTALILFFIQLVLNSLWSIIFFGLHLTLIAFIEIILLWFVILFMIIKFYSISKTASLIQIPYILWVSFAAVLNFSFAALNAF